jgi:hypothetical protein
MKAIYCSDWYSSAVLFILLSKRILTVDQRIYFNHCQKYGGNEGGKCL